MLGMRGQRRGGMWAVAAAALLAAALAWAHPAQVGCGPGQAGCGPAAVGTGGTTTTTLPATAPSWVPSMLGAWMLDEATGTRVNAQGTTARDMAKVGACASVTTMGNSTVDKMEGAASAVVVATSCLATTDTFAGVVAVTVGCWVKAAPPTGDAAFVMHDWSNSPNTVKLFRTAAGGYSFGVRNTGAVLVSATSANSWPTAVWSHVVGTLSAAGAVTLYVNGVQVAATTNTPVAAATLPFYLGENSTFAGNLDECVVDDIPMAAASVCRICSCGIRGEQCTCNGAAFTSTGRNATACGSCTLPADCSAAAPS